MKEVQRTRRVATGFEHTNQVPYFALRILISPKENLENLTRFNLTLTYLISKVDIRLFYYYNSYNEFNWKNYNENEDIKWESTEFKLKNEEDFNSSINLIIENFELFIMNYLKNRFNINELIL